MKKSNCFLAPSFLFDPEENALHQKFIRPGGAAEYRRALAEHIVSSLEEELRVLYVAMTRFEQDTCGHLYLRGLSDALRATPWQYSQLQAFVGYDHEPLEVLPYMQRYLQYPFLEYMVKLGLYNLARHTVYGSSPGRTFFADGQGPREILGIAMEDIPLLQSLNATPNQLILLRELRRRGFRPDESLLRWYQE